MLDIDEKMNIFSSKLFHTLINPFGATVGLTSVSIELGKKLIKSAKMHTKGLENGMYGVSYHIGYQGRRNSDMLTDFELATFEFVGILREEIWRRRKLKFGIIHRPFCTVTMRMTKFQGVSTHVVDFVQFTGFGAKFVDEAFEHI